MRRHHPSESSLLIRYEDFVADPQATLRDVVELVGETPTEIPVSKDREVVLGENHTAAGNPSRFLKGRIRLRLDDEWVTEQKPGHRFVTTGLSLTLLKRYGYEVRVGERARVLKFLHEVRSR